MDKTVDLPAELHVDTDDAALHKKMLEEMERTKSAYCLIAHCDGRHGLVWYEALKAGDTKVCWFDSHVAGDLSRSLRRVVDRAAAGKGGRKIA